MKAININGKIKLYGKLPNVWGNIINFSKSSEEVIKEKGFFDVIQPILTTYQKQGDIFFDDINKIFTYTVIDFTQEEIERYDESKLDNDISAKKEMKYEDDGQRLYRKIKNRIRRKLDNSTITLNQFNAIRRTLRPEILPLTTGDWDIAQENLNALTPPTNAKLLAILNNIKGQVDDYITNNY